jgi:hypothetical protein
MDAQCSRYAAAIRVQKGRQEVIQDLQSMIIELLKTFYQTCGAKPERICFYRDGVSEGQFSDVLRIEMEAIRGACSTLEATYRPTITYIVVQKRHHARFFPIRKEDSDKSGNVLPGTVVESGITHPSGKYHSSFFFLPSSRITNFNTIIIIIIIVRIRLLSLLTSWFARDI